MIFLSDELSWWKIACLTLALSQHVTELQTIVAQRKKQAAALLREGIELQRQKKNAEALTRYRESEALWPVK